MDTFGVILENLLPIINSFLTANAVYDGDYFSAENVAQRAADDAMYRTEHKSAKERPTEKNQDSHTPDRNAAEYAKWIVSLLYQWN